MLEHCARLTSLDGGEIELDIDVVQIAWTKRDLPRLNVKEHTEVWIITDSGVQFGFSCLETHDMIQQRIAAAKVPRPIAVIAVAQ